MVKALNFLPQKIIETSFYLLFFLVPLVLTPFNYELFEYNKMMLTYGLTAIIVGFWLIKMIAEKRINIRRTPLDIPLLLFLASQIASTIISMDRHVSIWGYYSRFNGGLASTVSYILLFYAFISNFPSKNLKKLLKIALVSGVLVSIYGILEHFGVDKDIWVQDVQNRVFSTLGQPNWLAAYLAVLIPITIGLSINSKSQTPSSKQSQNSKRFNNLEFENWNLFGSWNLVFVSLVAVFYATLIFTKSRSGFLGFWAAILIFSIFLLWKYKKAVLKFLLFVICSLFFVTFLFGAPFDQINRFTLPQLINKQPASTRDESTRGGPTGGSVIETGITESGTIRRIVWTGAIDIFRHYPLFGTGVETFAFSYYKFRPAEHNMTSEWDFLYNKAHNEYLNYAATTGTFGLGSYLLIILVFIGWNLNRIIKFQTPSSKQYSNSNVKNPKNAKSLDLEIWNLFGSWNLVIGLFAGWLSILITNFFGFSVVIIQLFFFLIPAIVFSLSENYQPPTTNHQPISRFQSSFCFIVTLFIIYILYSLGRLWYADVVFADGYHRERAAEITGAYQSLKKALEINDGEPFYYDEFSYPAAQIAVAASDEKEASLSAALTKEAIIASNFAVSHAPQNVNFWKTRTRVFYALSQMDEKYFDDALYALEQAEILSPTDPKVKYNLGLLYDRMGKKEEAVKKLEEAAKLKSDYRDAFFALAYLYEKDNKRDKAKEALKYILTKIATDDAEAKKKLEELR